MPYYFLSEAVVAEMRSALESRIKALEEEIRMKKEFWNDLGNKYEHIPAKIEPSEPFALPEETVRMKLKEPVKLECPKCHSEKLWKQGVYQGRKGPEQKYECQECSKRFQSPIIRRNMPRGAHAKKAETKPEPESAKEIFEKTISNLADDPDRAFKPFGLNKLTQTSGDGEKIEQEYIDEVTA